MTRVEVNQYGFKVFRDDMKHPWIPYFVPKTYSIEHLAKIIREGWK